MERAQLHDWATRNGTHLEDGADRKLSLTSKLIRFRWNGSPTVAVGSDADSKTPINAVLDGLAWALHTYPGDNTLHLIVGVARSDAEANSRREQLGAIGTLITALRDGPRIRLWQISSDTHPHEIAVAAASFTTSKPADWATLLVTARDAHPTGLAANVIDAIGHPSAALYPKLSSQDTTEPWQIRIDGLDIGRVGSKSGTLRLASTKPTAPGRPRTQWLEIVGPTAVKFDSHSLQGIAATVRRLTDAFTVGVKSGGVLDHGQPEHALEAHVLSGRLKLHADEGPLRLAIPNTDNVLRAAQFPTLWGDVSHPARYLDALLADDTGRPWAVELKDQNAGGGHGAYLRAGIGQAVLYRHYIRTADQLAPWFRHHQLNPSQCEAALAFPTASPAAAATIVRHIEIARRYGIEVIQFARPGTPHPSKKQPG